MSTSGWGLWERYCRYRFSAPALGFALDISRVAFEDDFFRRMAPAMLAALDAMAALEAGAIANTSEDRMVGHYWLRAPHVAPTPTIGAAIREAAASVRHFADAVNRGDVRGTDGPFEHVLHVGIGGSALGPQLLCDAFAGAEDRRAVHFLDNADPDGIDRLVDRLDGALGRTLVSVVSKSGHTPTPMQVTTELEMRYRQQGLEFPRHAVATTMVGTALDRRAREQGWLARFPLWDWVGGRTSVTSAVALLPAALQGVDIVSF
ncbi:MAG: glucose-6-phosphate isomerase, partial [Actinobacteria bacterium]|nr:glucose-6-phosphate isomerase [Actinomycetota bacterium]